MMPVSETEQIGSKLLERQMNEEGRVSQSKSPFSFQYFICNATQERHCGCNVSAFGKRIDLMVGGFTLNTICIDGDQK